MSKKIICCILIIVVIVGCVIGRNQYLEQFEIDMEKGMNIGNALDSPKDLSWGVEMSTAYIDVIAEAGFDTVRLPIRFSDYVDENNVLDETFMQEIDSYIEYALEKELVIIIDFHHFLEIMENPEEYEETFFEIWSQLSIRYQDYPKELVFELLNEPQGNLTSDLWNEYIEEGVAIIRETNPTRKIIIGTSNYYNISTIDDLILPKDNHLIVSFHYYEPFEFTFQSDLYHVGYEDISGVTWTGTDEQLAYLEEQFQIVADWADERNVPVFLGEFGVNQNVPDEYRAYWIDAVINEAENQGFSWAYWEISSSFGIYDSSRQIWNTDILDAMMD